MRDPSLVNLDGMLHATHELRPINWLDVVAMHVEGIASRWVNVALQDVIVGCKPTFYTWAQFKEAVVQQLESVTQVEEALKQLPALRQTGRVVGYVQKS